VNVLGTKNIELLTKKHTSMKTKALFVIMYVAGCLVMSAQAQQEEVPPPKAYLQTSFETPDLTNIRIKEDPGETLEYIGKIGNDFDTALDSLKTLKNITSEIIKEPLAVIFDYDDRLFFGIIYGDCGMYSDVIDTKGNYYLRTWYSSDDGMTVLPKAYQQTSFNMFNQLAADPEADDNICFSPLSVQIALSMVQNGADGNTLKEMQTALGTYGYSNEEINAFNQSLITSITSRPPFDPNDWKWYVDNDEEEARKYYDAAYPTCEIANSVWYRPDVRINDSFIDILKSSYDGGIGSVEFDTEEGIGEINRWVNDKTHGMIPKIYEEPQSDELAVVLANALYFKGSWSDQFDAGMTKPDVFHCGDGSAVKTDMMCSMSEYHAAVNDKFRMLTLFYGRKDYSMTLFVPVEGTTLPELTSDDWQQTMTEAYEQEHQPYAVYMPKFDFNGKYNLKSVLMKMGINDAFDEYKADFTKMYADHNRAIDKVFQLSRISVDEEGTEAAAVTVIEMPDCAGPDPDDYKEFRVDRPFYFTIENRKQQSVLFVGRVATLEGEAIVSLEGDVNGDDEVNISDVVAIINTMAGNENFRSASDVNGDKKVDISDVVAVINIMAGQ
jgi:serpin B